MAALVNNANLNQNLTTGPFTLIHPANPFRVRCRFQAVQYKSPYDLSIERLYLHRTRYALMLRAGLSPAVVQQRMMVVDGIDPTAASEFIVTLQNELQNQQQQAEIEQSREQSKEEEAELKVVDMKTQRVCGPLDYQNQSIEENVVPVKRQKLDLDNERLSLNRTRYALMLRAGLSPAAVQQKMIVVDGIDVTTAADFITSLQDELVILDQQKQQAENNNTQRKLEEEVEREKRVVLGERVFTVEDVLNKKECEGLVDQSEGRGFHRNLKDKKSLDQRLRNDFYDDDLSSVLFNRLRSSLPQHLSNGRTLHSVRNKFRLLRYNPGDKFDYHVDGGFLQRNGKDKGISSVYTILIYLSDLSSTGLVGGETVFCELPGLAPLTKIEPKMGRALLFKQKHTKHSGAPVIEGTKYLLQGMVLYTPPTNGVLPHIFEFIECPCDVEDNGGNDVVEDEDKDNNSVESWAIDVSKKPWKRMVRMMIAGSSEQMIRQRISLEKVAVPSLRDLIYEKIAEAARGVLEKRKLDPEASNEKVDGSLEQKASGIEFSRYYQMLKAGLMPGAVLQSMLVVGELPRESAEGLLKSLLATLQAENEQ
eukprot:TRINITY_DN34_c0_g1_i1.p1 TRINITY_DN34_c0_g1~~TRINITY_DN34_c0_g1_i1.p1  ORF type:complete len:608 (-),score=134.43 TRINITY_DN34_c0_g1_i1:78-1853(-)